MSEQAPQPAEQAAESRRRRRFGRRFFLKRFVDKLTEGGILDHKFLEQPMAYLAQCGLAIIGTLASLLILDVAEQPVMIAAFGSSAFLAFSLPHSLSTQPRFLIGGYVVGTLVGIACSLAARMPFLVHLFHGTEFVAIGFGALSTGAAMLLMVATDTEHPPAAGLALGFVFNDWHWYTAALVLVSIVTITGVKEAARPRLINLL